VIKKIKSFDGTEKINTIIEKPEKYNSLFQRLTKGGFIPRGAGLSYCLASAANNVSSIDSVLFNRVLSFDKINSLIKVEAGMNLGDLLKIIIPENFTFPVLPGYPKITIGGCIGFNVHGKSQFNIGLFGDYVNSIKLFHPAHGEIECNEFINSDILELTIGGFGLTGFITEVELKLVPLKSKSVIRSKILVKNISEAVQIISTKENDFTSIYSWNNLNRKNKNFGKGIVYLEKYADQDNCNCNIIKYNNLSSENRGNFKFNFYTNITTYIECLVYESIERISSSQSISRIENVSFPINGREIYFKLFGNKGLREYQMIIPFNNWTNFEQELYTVINKIKMPITLGSLKLFKGEQKLLTFRKSGICLAIDVPANDKSVLFFNLLDALVLKYDGIANISKDSRLSSDVIKRMYPEYNEFIKRLNEFEGNNPLNSNLRERIF
jgi:decaprenylphospho-beta-D-ribofuranose 2-oxidase